MTFIQGQHWSSLRQKSCSNGGRLANLIWSLIERLNKCLGMPWNRLTALPCEKRVEEDFLCDYVKAIEIQAKFYERSPKSFIIALLESRLLFKCTLFFILGNYSMTLWPSWKLQGFIFIWTNALASSCALPDTHKYTVLDYFPTFQGSTCSFSTALYTVGASMLCTKDIIPVSYLT